MKRGPNRGLEALIAEAGWSHAGLAKRVNAVIREAHGLTRAYTATSVANWIGGMIPADPTPAALNALFTERLGRRIRASELGFLADSPVDLGLAWYPSLRATVDAVANLWTADMERREALLASTWTALAFAVPAREWLLACLEDDAGHIAETRVGKAEIDVVWSMCRTFADADRRLGGGYARATLLHYVNHVVAPMLNRACTEKTGRMLMAAAARMCNLCGFMAFDSGAQGLGQRYHIQALRLAQASRQWALGAHILADMSMQAQYLGDAAEACSLARVGAQAARRAGSRSSLARCSAMEARAHARAKDGRRCDAAMNRAEDMLAGARVDDEPLWIQFFTADQLHAEFAYAASDLGRPREVERFASKALAQTGQMERRRVLVGSALASSYLMSSGQSTPDVEQACEVLQDTTALIGVLTTQRGLDAVRDVRSRLKPYADHPRVRQLEERLASLDGPS